MSVLNPLWDSRFRYQRRDQRPSKTAVMISLANPTARPNRHYAWVPASPLELVKLLLAGPDGEVETPWAEKISDRLFRLDNMPFFAYGVSVDDIVEAEPTEDEGFFRFLRVHQSSGNRTIRV